MNPGDYYLVAMTLIFGATYFALYFFFPFLVGQKPAALSRRSLNAVLIIVGLSIATSFIASIIPNLALSNRFLHAIGGGFLAMFVCFLASRDSNIKISKFQLLSISFLVTTFLGVGNELAEFALQSITGFPFTDSLTDTWLDLTSNTVGALIASVSLLPFLKGGDRLR